MKKYILVGSLVGLLGLTAVNADTLLSGSATIDYDSAAWSTLASGFGPTPVLSLGAYFNQADASARTQAQLLADLNPGGPASYLGQVYAMNGASVVNLSGRYTQPTTFAYTPGSLSSHTGSIGLGGVARFDVYGGVFGSLLFGDFTLQYDAARSLVGGSGWYLKGNIPPAAAAYDLLNVSITEAPGTFTISGDLGVSYEIANFLYATPGDTLKDVGNFTFTATTVPEPSALALLGLGVLLPLLRRKN
ncbi:MAG: PEP-CTERM sorting domain-containing protein [Verrucomicrobia bacterium]|nr:PEP-CTERM sorting domain-containing protein [Verrucomicrobiota bacterium]